MILEIIKKIYSISLKTQILFPYILIVTQEILILLIKPFKINEKFINTYKYSKRKVINEKDLLNILKNKSIRLGLDVIKNENKKINFSQKTIKQNKNVLITPHVAGLTKESIEKTDKKILKEFYEEKNF